MPETTKCRILRYLAERGRVDNPHELQQAADTGTHNVVHLLYSCQKAGLITFRTGRPPAWRSKPTRGGVSERIPTKIEITQKGREWLAREA